jgi:hypothetical protein
MADDDRRVEPKQVLVGTGIGTTPERIADIRARTAELEKLSRPKPTQEFGAVLAAKSAGRPKAEPSAKEKRKQALPKKGPRPGIAHPSQREAYGRDDDDDPVIIKG